MNCQCEFCRLFWVLINVAFFYRMVALSDEMQMIIIVEADWNALKRFRLWLLRYCKCWASHFVQYTETYKQSCCKWTRSNDWPHKRPIDRPTKRSDSIQMCTVAFSTNISKSPEHQSDDGDSTFNKYLCKCNGITTHVIGNRTACPITQTQTKMRRT